MSCSYTRLDRLVQRPDWHRDALCVGRTELFYGKRATEADALAICVICSVRVDCLVEAFNDERDVGRCYGTRGGMTADQRQARLRDGATVAA